MSKKNKETATVAEDLPKKESAKKEKNSSKKNEPQISEAQLEAEKERYMRLFAEFENYKKRTTKERIELFKTASQDVMVSLLPVIDDFDRALKEIEKAEDNTVLKGVELISNKLKETLRQKGLEAVTPSQGEVFNADFHEAITQIPAPEEDLKGKIIDVIEKGYKLGEKIIRYPKVVIGN